MEFTQDPTPDGIIISMRGSFTFKDHYCFRAVLDALAATNGSCKMLDLSKVEFLDSAALGMLLIAEEETARGHGTLTLRNPSGPITRLFELSAMDTIFKIERTAEIPR
jgi:HptB-dependent secretion and biofilm anti anti-sigma factor